MYLQTYFASFHKIITGNKCWLVENLFQILLIYVYLSSACIMSSKRKEKQCMYNIGQDWLHVTPKKKDW